MDGMMCLNFNKEFQNIHIFECFFAGSILDAFLFSGEAKLALLAIKKAKQF